MKLPQPFLTGAIGMVGMLLPLCATAATEYFVSLEGDDSHDGTSPASSFRTIQHGVDALAPGDILTIAPGEYMEAVSRENLGSADVETLIRAEIPGTVLLRGDVPAPRFEKVDGYDFIYAADLEEDLEVQAVNEIDTLTILLGASNLAMLDFNPGRF